MDERHPSESIPPDTLRNSARLLWIGRHSDVNVRKIVASDKTRRCICSPSESVDFIGKYKQPGIFAFCNASEKHAFLSSYYEHILADLWLLDETVYFF